MRPCLLAAWLPLIIKASPSSAAGTTPIATVTTTTTTKTATTATLHPPGPPMAPPLHLLDGTDALCLDGTPAGFYISRSTMSSDDTKWQIYLNGGAWCYNEFDCYNRSFEFLGSSATWADDPAAIEFLASSNGYMSSNCSLNPTTCNFNKVWVGYCDLTSFSGDRTEPIVVNGKSIWFRGKRNLERTLEALVQQYGLADATEVMLTGQSAGGQATILHTNLVQEYLARHAPSMHKFAAVPVSGFFIDIPNINGMDVYESQIKYIFKLSNASVDPGCIADHGQEERYKCMMAPYAYPYMKARTYTINSALDSLHTSCALFSYGTEIPSVNCFFAPYAVASSSMNECLSVLRPPGNLTLCSEKDAAILTRYMKDFRSALATARKGERRDNGAFIFDDYTHNLINVNSRFTGIRAEGLTMSQALNCWWHADSIAPTDLVDDGLENTLSPPQ